MIHVGLGLLGIQLKIHLTAISRFQSRTILNYNSVADEHIGGLIDKAIFSLQATG